MNAKVSIFNNIESVVLPDGVMSIVTPRQTHTANVAVVTSPDQSFPETDALITQLPGIAVGVRTADCVPILLHAPDIDAVAAVHAGWKGTLGRIVGNTIDRMVGMGADPAEMTAFIAPHICGDCYEVSGELARYFMESGLSEAVIPSIGRPHIDIAKANNIIMTLWGLHPDNITDSGLCTLHSTSQENRHYYPSWRRSPGTTIRLLSTIFLLPAFA